MARQSRDLDAMSDEEVEAELAALDRHRPSGHQLAGGAPRGFAAMLTLLTALGTFASVQLILAEIELLENPGGRLSCDLNPLIGCGTFLTRWESGVLGFPNSVLGTVGFAGMLALALALLADSRLGRWVWRAMVAWTWGALVFVLWFMSVSFFSVHSLCPWCLVIWLVTIPIVIHVNARAVQGGHVSYSGAVDRVLVADRRILTVVAYALLAAAIIWAYWDKWVFVLPA